MCGVTENEGEVPVFILLDSSDAPEGTDHIGSVQELIERRLQPPDVDRSGGYQLARPSTKKRS